MKILMPGIGKRYHHHHHHHRHHRHHRHHQTFADQFIRRHAGIDIGCFTKIYDLLVVCANVVRSRSGVWFLASSLRLMSGKRKTFPMRITHVMLTTEWCMPFLVGIKTSEAGKVHEGRSCLVSMPFVTQDFP